jgi:SAM-dependent methyltransferase
MKSAGPKWYSSCGLYEGSDAALPCRWEYEQFRLARLPGKTLLDVGCGRGDFALQASELGYQVCGVDIQARSLDAARKRVPGGRFDLLDVQVEPLPGPFDVITAFEVIEHLERPLEALSRVAAGLAQGGHLAISVPCIERRPFFKRLSVVDYPPHHLTMWTQRAITLLLKAAGLNVVYVVKKGFDSGDFSLLLEDYFSIKSRLTRRLSGLVCRRLEPVLRRWPDAGGCTIFAVTSKPSGSAQYAGARLPLETPRC